MAEHLKKVLAAAGRLRERAVSACFSATFRVPGANFGRRMRLVRSQEHTAGGGFRIGNTCTPMVDSSQCIAKPIQYCKVKKENKK